MDTQNDPKTDVNLTPKNDAILASIWVPKRSPKRCHFIHSVPKFETAACDTRQHTPKPPQIDPFWDHFGPLLAQILARSRQLWLQRLARRRSAVSRGSRRVLAQTVTAFGRVRAIMAWSVAVPKHDIPDYITFRGGPNDGLGGCPHRGAIGHDPFWSPFGPLLARSWQKGAKMASGGPQCGPQMASLASPRPWRPWGHHVGTPNNPK